MIIKLTSVMSISPVISTSVDNKVNTPIVSSSILIDTSYAIGGSFTAITSRYTVE